MRSKKAILNTSTSLIYQVVATICGFITPRLILVTFGSTYNGIIASATQFMSMISILTLGIGGAVRVALYKTLADNDTLGTSRIVKATQKYMYKVGLSIVLYAIILMTVYPLISHNSLPHIEASALIGIVAIGTFAEYFFGVTYKTLLTADQSEYISSILQIIVTVLNTVVVATLIFSNQNIFIVKLFSVFVFALSPLFLNFYVNKKYSLIKNCEADNSALKQRKAVAFHSIANIVHNNTDLIILTIFTDAKLVSVYTVYNYAVGKIRAVLQSLTVGLEAAFGNMWVKKEIDNISKNFRIYEFVVFSFISIVFSCVGLLILPFVELFSKGVTDIVYVRTDLAVLITVTEAVYCIRDPYLTLVQATGHYKETKNGAIFEAVVNIVSSVILVNILGINGIIIGTLLANLIRTIQYIWFVSKRILYRGYKEIILKVIWTLLNLALIMTVSFPVISHNQVPGWIGWFLKAFIVLAIAFVITVISSAIFYRKELSSLIQIIKRALSRNKTNE